MNKILIASEDLTLDNEEILIEEITKDLNLYLKGKVSCGIKKIKKNGTITKIKFSFIMKKTQN